MSPRDDHPDEMRREPGPDDRLAEEILRGRTGAVPPEYHSLAEVVSSIRYSSTPPPEPSAALRHVFEEGIRRDEADETAPAPQAAPATRGRMRLRRALPRLAGVGLAVKAVLAGAAAAAVAAGGAGAAGVLPGQDGPPAFLPWHLEDTDVADEADLGEEVSDEAVDDTGVDGPDVAERAREPRGDERGDPLRTGDQQPTPPAADPDDPRDDAAEEHADEAGEPERTEPGPPAEQPETEPPAERDERDEAPASHAPDERDEPASDPVEGSSTGDEPAEGDDAVDGEDRSPGGDPGGDADSASQDPDPAPPKGSR